LSEKRLDFVLFFSTRFIAKVLLLAESYIR